MTDLSKSPQGAGPAVSPASDGAYDAELSSLLQRLSDPSPAKVAQGRGRALVPIPPNGLLSALLLEIDATVMARRLTFSSDSGHLVEMEVLNRRLLHFTEGARDTKSDAPAGTSLTYAGPKELAKLREALERLCAAGGLWVQSHKPSGIVGVEDTGVSVSVLRDAVKSIAKGAEALPHATQPSAAACDGLSEDATHRATLHNFLDACAEDCIAWLLRSGDAGGDPEYAPDLEILAQGFFHAPQTILPKDGATALCSDLPDDAPVFLALWRGEALAMLLAPGTEARTVSRWADVMLAN